MSYCIVRIESATCCLIIFNLRLFSHSRLVFNVDSTSVWIVRVDLCVLYSFFACMMNVLSNESDWNKNKWTSKLEIWNDNFSFQSWSYKHCDLPLVPQNQTKVNEVDLWVDRPSFTHFTITLGKTRLIISKYMHSHHWFLSDPSGKKAQSCFFPYLSSCTGATSFWFWWQVIIQRSASVLPAVFVIHSSQVPRPREQILHWALRDVAGCVNRTQKMWSVVCKTQNYRIDIKRPKISSQ